MPSVLEAEALAFFGREPLRNLGSPVQGQLMPRLLSDDLGPGMSRGNVRPGDHREAIDQPIQPAVIGGLQQHGVFANEHFGLNQGKLQSGEAGPGKDSGTVQEQKSLRWGRFTIGRIKLPRLGFRDRPIGPQGGEQPLAVADRPAQLIQIDQVIPRCRLDQLTERFQIDGVGRRLGGAMYRRRAATAAS